MAETLNFWGQPGRGPEGPLYSGDTKPEVALALIRRVKFTRRLERFKSYAVQETQTETLSRDVGGQGCRTSRDRDSTGHASPAGEKAKIQGGKAQADPQAAAGGFG